MPTEYYAHSLEGRPQEEWQKLSEHLKNVANLAKQFAEPIGIRELAYLAGLLHDLGKYQPEFQKYLSEGGKRGSVPHSVWGAGFARIHKMDEIAFVIDGHHKGLPNKSDLKNDTEAFKRNEIPGFDNVVKTFLSDNNITENELAISKIEPQEAMQRELLIRYLFSALTDAVWLNTEAYFKIDESKNRVSQSLKIDELIHKLEKELSSKSKNGEINQLRNQMRELVLKKADMPCGFYSLNLPTGVGKTLISMAWALKHAKEHKLKRILIVLPYINIIDQTAHILKDIFGEEWVLEHHSAYNENETAAQNDEYNLDPIKKRKVLACENWDYPIIVTTTVQFFESLFSNKRSKCRKIHNMAESVVIFDEVQSLPKEILLPTLSMLKNIQKVMNTSFLFCTATLPAFEKRDKFNGIDTIYPLVDNPLEVFNKTKRVDYNLLQKLDLIDINTLMNAVSESGTSVLVIFNTKKATLKFYELAMQNSRFWERCYHLSTAMCPSHRFLNIEAIKNDLDTNKKIIVSSTQLIEAGVDFDFPCVFREMAPLESIIQSAGRCNREGKLPNNGKVYLFQLQKSSMPDKTYKACADYTKSLIQDNLSKLDRHNFFQEYYSRVVNLFIEPDKNNIIQAQEGFNFETVNDSYRLIQHKTEGLYIYNYNNDSKRLFHSIENKDFLSRDDYRKMQMFTVQVFNNFLFKNEGIYKKMPQEFFVWYGNYDYNTGISVKPIEADKLVV